MKMDKMNCQAKESYLIFWRKPCKYWVAKKNVKNGFCKLMNKNVLNVKVGECIR